ncbi:MAG TPA: class I SAM-dependent methyltransferase [Pirellulales bacterium]|nr:class I SAM-dependent methyltransferase [Pirellulales bacterium]
MRQFGHAARETGRRLEVFGVDLDVGVSDPKSWYQDSSALVAVIMQAGLQDTVSFIAAESTLAAERFDDLDFAFIDAAHDYQSVLADRQAWWPKIKKGGILAGHDFSSAQFPGVKQAVEAFFGRDICNRICVANCWQIIR